ncbi:hypothetical protein GGS23DRAFT_599415 [Durotheca rogersii]|uniref:uncharacterized protein n=1 Tax=Durotheca rogersii TaxID=419775 RepID=UPI002220F901|nr:uncharacterized protein GGS23DRAFT_599415 [Durotheca rogersii]KAI5860607.1 hypothetical protein GGS23DRAFT_599415 [Durotheca rogersii]
MDWPMEGTDWNESNLNSFNFEERSTTVLQKRDSDTTLVKETLEGQDWESWIDKTQDAISAGNGLYVVLFSRAEPVFEGIPAPVSCIPVTKDVWKTLIKLFRVHRSIARTIARMATFVASDYEQEDESAECNIFFTARMSTHLNGDLALSLTYIPSTESTLAVMYGCSPRQIQEIEKRIRAAGERTKYPLLMLGIFAELERHVLSAMVESLLGKFVLRATRLETGSWDPSQDLTKEKTQDQLRMCIESMNLKDHIRGVKRQISKLLAEMDQFEDHFVSHGGDDGGHKALWFKRVGLEMKKRLKDIMNDYEEKIDECNMIVENITLAAQTVWNQIAMHDSELNTRIARANTTIALETKRESTQMRSIALLTMIYLPISSVATVFSMNLFNWEAGDGEPVVSHYIWVFIVFAVGFTAITLSVWIYLTRRHEKEERKIADRYQALELQSKMA